MAPKNPFDTEKTTLESPPKSAKPFDTDEKTVHVVPGSTVPIPDSERTLNVVLPDAKTADAEKTVDGLPGASNPALPSMTLDAPVERPPKPIRIAATIHESSRPHDTLDDPPGSPKAVSAEDLPAPAPLANVSEVELMLPASAKAAGPKPANSLDALAPLPRMVLDKRVVAGLPILLALGLTVWAFSAPEVISPPPPDIPFVAPPPPPVEPARPSLVDSDGVFVDVIVDGKAERRAGGKVKLFSNPVANVTTVKGLKLGKTPTEVIAEVGPLDLIFDNHELGLTKAVTINVRPGNGGKETIDFGRGWLDIDAPAGSKVSVDGKSLGTAPVAQQTLYEGRHTVTIVGPEGWKNTRQVSVVAGQTVSHVVGAPR